MRDRLLELIDDCRYIEGYGLELVEKQVDYLLANGVLCPPCKVGIRCIFTKRKLMKFALPKLSRYAIIFIHPQCLCG